MYRPARRLAEIEPFHVVELLTRARQLEADGRDIIHMEVGEPDFPTPEPIANAAVNAIKQAKTLYTQALGLELDLVARGMGVRMQRFSAIVVDGVVKSLNVEQPGKFEVSDAQTLLKQAESVIQYLP